MIRRKRVVSNLPLDVDLNPDPDFFSGVASHDLNAGEQDSSVILKQQLNQNKKFLVSVTKLSAPEAKLPPSITDKDIEETLKVFNQRVGNIAFSKQILEDYEKHFQGMRAFFQKIIQQDVLMSPAETIIWRMFFVNNLAIIAFNNGDYTTSLQLLKSILAEQAKSQIKHSVFSLAIVNLSAIYHKMNNKAKCYQFMEMSFERSKNLLDLTLVKGQDKTSDMKFNSILVIQCIMMMKRKQLVEGKTNTTKEVNKLMIRLIKEVGKVNPDSINIPFVTRYLQQKKISQLKDILSSKADSTTGSKDQSHTARKRTYVLRSLKADSVAGLDLQPDLVQRQTSYAENSPPKRYLFNKLKMRVDQLSSSFKRLEQQSNDIQSFMVQLVQLIKNRPEEKEPLSQSQTSANNAQPPKKMKMQDKRIFKTLQVHIQFHDQGVLLKTLTGHQEKITWGELNSIFNHMDLVHLYFPYVEANPTKHTIAWLVSKYLHSKDRIKIQKQPQPVLCFNHDKICYGLYHIKNRKFAICGKDIRTLNYEMCEKSFDYYFNVLKTDQYYNECSHYFGDEQRRQLQEYFLETIQLRDGINFQEDICQLFGNLKMILRANPKGDQVYHKVKLWFDPTVDSYTFMGVYYRLSIDLALQKIRVRMHNLNEYQGLDKNQYVEKYRPFGEQQSIDFTDITQIPKQNVDEILSSVADCFSLAVKIIRAQGKTKYIMYAIEVKPEHMCFQQRVVLKKYYRPILVYVEGLSHHFTSIRIAHYNENLTVTTNLAVILDSTTFTHRESRPCARIPPKWFLNLKKILKTTFLVKLLAKLQVNDGQPKITVIHLEEFIRLIEDTENV